MFRKQVHFEQIQYSPTVIEFRCKNKLSSSVYLILLATFITIGLGSIYLSSNSMVQVFLVAFILFLPILYSRYIVIEESITVITNFGLQQKLKYLTGVERMTFVEVDKLDRYFIHEYIYGSEVKFSLAILLLGEKRLLLAFKHLYPGFQNLQHVYGYLKHSLWSFPSYTCI